MTHKVNNYEKFDMYENGTSQSNVHYKIKYYKNTYNRESHTYEKVWALSPKDNSDEYTLEGNTIGDLKNLISVLKEIPISKITFKIYSKHENKDSYFTDRECIGQGWFMSQYDKDILDGRKPKMEPYYYSYNCDCGNSFQLIRILNTSDLLVCCY